MISNKWKLKHCQNCNQMTNHDDNGCLKCRNRLEATENNLDTIDQIIDEIWCAGYNAGANDLDDDNTEFIEDMRYGILSCVNQPVERQLDETRLTGELKNILVKSYCFLNGCKAKDIHEDSLVAQEVNEVTDKFLAWHETEKQKYAMDYADKQNYTQARGAGNVLLRD